MRIVAPCRMFTFTDAPVPLPHAVAATHSAPSANRRSDSARTAKRMLKEHRRRERIDVAFAIARLAAHLAHRAQRVRGRVALVDEIHRLAGTLLDLLRD